ncbi:MAG: flagellar hook-length control protein FliK [Gemmata sp.]
MATPVANLPALIPPATADTSAPTNKQTTGASGSSFSPFQSVLASALNQQTAETAKVTATEDTNNNLETGLETESEADQKALAADASIAGLLVLVPQVLSQPDNASIAQATGLVTEGLTASTGLGDAAQPTIDATGTGNRTRADQLQLDRAVAALPNTDTLAAPSVPSVTALSNPSAAQTDAAVPVTTDATQTPATIPSQVLPGGPSIPAQAPIVANLIPPVPAPANLSVQVPPVPEPMAAVAPSALPSAQLGQRPATAGEQFVADATAGARLAATATGSVEFANTLAQDVTVPAVSAAPDLAPPSVSGAEPLAPVAVSPLIGGVDVAGTAFGESDASETVPAATFGRAVADIARATAPSQSPLATDVTVAPLATEPPPVEVPIIKDETRSTDAPTASPLPGGGPTAPAAVKTAPTEATAVRSSPAAQISDTIVTHAHVLEQNGRVEFQMRLDPPELGRLQIRLVARGDEMHGHVIVANEAVRGMIESQLPELRQRLEAAGVSLQSFDVSTDPGTGGGRNPYRDATTEFLPRVASSVGAAPRPRAARTGGSLDVTV